MRKRLLSGLLALCMVVSLLSVTVWAEPTDATATKIREDAENIVWGAEHPVEIAYSTYGGIGGSCCTASGRVRLDLTSVVIGFPDESWSGVTETPTSFNIPAQVDGLSVTDLGAVDIFYEASNLFHFAKVETVTVPEGVKYLHGSFAVAQNLKAVVLPTSLIYIGGNAFASCTALASINFPNNLAYIAEDAFSGCASLLSIDFPESLLYIGPRAFSDCMALQRVTIPKNVGQIESGAFVNCPNLTIYCYTNSCAHQYAIEHNIPFVLLDGEPEESDIAQIRKLSPQAGTKGVNYGSGNPPVFEIEFDRRITSIETIAGTFSVYLAPDDELLYSSRAADDLQFSGATLTVTPDIQLKPATEYYITLDGAAIRFEDNATNPAIVKGQWQFETASTELDLLALSLLSYKKPTTEPKGKSIRELIGDDQWDEYWDKNWEKVDIRNNELFANLADWKVYDYCSDEPTGFAAYAFYNESNEFVIAYRGSAGDRSDPKDWWEDWWANDAKMFLGGKGSQLDQAMKFYSSVVAKSGSNNITVTGHSLGGGLADIIAACYGCPGESFNSAPFLDVAYWYYPEKMAALFEGTDAFIFKAHANESDRFVGNNPGERIKPLWLYEGNGLVTSAHSLASIVTKDDGSLKLTKFISQRSPSVISQKVSVLRNNKVVFGTTISDNLKYSSALTDLVINYAVYGGAGADDIITSKTGDTISGGRGNDTIDGGWGDDTYIYYKGHGIDTINDTSGHDKLILCGFRSSDTIEVEEGDNTHAYVTVNGSTIVKIAKRRSNPVTGWNNSFTVTDSSDQGFEKNIESYLTDKRNFVERLQFSCPVNVEIINDATGKVVYTLYDQIEVTDYTDYGNFYVFEQEDGEYVKIADLIEGYSARVVGVGGGTMDVVVLDTDGFNLSEPYTAQDVPVTKDMIATVEEDSNGGKILVIDTDADGQPDLTVPLTASADAPTTYTVSVRASPTEGGSVTGGGSYDEGASATVKATANNGCSFVRWTEEDGTTASTDASYTFTVEVDRTLTAVFEKDPELPAPTKYIVTVNASPTEGGSVTGGGSYDEGTSVTVKAVANSGYRFVRWTENGTTVSTNATYTFDATKDQVLTAVFEPISSGAPGGGGYTPTPSNPSYQITAPTTSNGTVTVTPTSAKSGTKVIITATPNDGYTIDIITVTDSSGKIISVTDNGDGTYTFTMPSSKVTVAATFVPIQEEPWLNPFTDVSENDWFYNEVAYVVQNGLMKGVDDGSRFDPYSDTTRGMIMTILARMMGIDTNGGSTWYEKGMAWAVENGVSDGTNPGEPISREQLAAMLYRFAEKPDADISVLDSYPDSSSVHTWTDFPEAMAWAVETGIIKGIDGKLVPEKGATRSEAATMLMRFCESIEE